MKIDCSNCMTTITVSAERGVATHYVAAQGRGSKRTEATKVERPVWLEGHLIVWEAPCCEDYVDSYEGSR